MSHSTHRKHESKTVDGGWGWACVAGGFVILFCISGMYRSSGILFVQILNAFGETTSLTAVMIGITMAASILSAPLASMLGDKYTFRAVCMFAGICHGLGHSLLFLAPNIYYVIIIYGIGQGFGIQVALISSTMVISKYFQKRQTLAMALVFTGGSLGQLIIPQILHILEENFDWRGVLLIYGGISFQMIWASALYRPIETCIKQDSHQRLDEVDSNLKDASGSIVLIRESNTIKQSAYTDSNVESCSISNLGAVNNAFDNNETIADSRLHVKLNKAYERSPPKVHNEQTVFTIAVAKSIDPYRSSVDILKNPEIDMEANKSAVNTERVGMAEAKNIKAGRESHPLCNLFRHFNYRLLLNPSFTILVCSSGVALVAYNDLYIFATAHAFNIGVSSADVHLMVTLAGCGDLVSRLFLGWIGTRDVIKPYVLLSILELISCVVILIAALAPPSYAGAFTIMMALALFSNGILIIVPTIMKDIIGVRNLPTGLAIVQIIMNLINCWMPSLFGFIKDQTGGYVIPLVICGTFYGIGSVGTVLAHVNIPCIYQHRPKRDKITHL